MKFSNIAILFTSVTCGTTAFTISTISNSRTTPSRSTKLFYLKDEVTTPVVLNKDMLATSVVKKIDHPLTTRFKTKLCPGSTDSWCYFSSRGEVISC